MDGNNSKSNVRRKENQGRKHQGWHIKSEAAPTGDRGRKYRGERDIMPGDDMN